MDRETKAIVEFLLARGWRVYPISDSWMYWPLPEWEGEPAPSQELFGIGRAYEMERQRFAPQAVAVCIQRPDGTWELPENDSELEEQPSPHIAVKQWSYSRPAG